MEYSEELKRKAVGELLGGKTAKQVCEEYGLSTSSLRQWQVDHVVSLPAGKSDAQVMNILKNRLYSQQLELEIWNQCTCFKKVSLSEKYDDMLKLVPKYGVHAVCKVLDVPRGTYYNRLLRSPDKTQLEEKDEKLKLIIIIIYFL